MARVALVYNLIHLERLGSRPLDMLAEYDSEETIAALRTALEAGGHEVLPLEADETIMEQLCETQPEIVFNIAEGLRGESREAHVPAICEMLGIPYTGSGPLSLATCLNKARTKEVLLHHGIPTARFQVLASAEAPLSEDLHYPLIVKLLHEGSSMGLSEASVVDDEAALRAQCAYLIETYGEPVLVEEFIEGREFTIGLLGNDPPEVLPIIEVIFDSPRGIVLFEVDPEVAVKMDSAQIDYSQLPYLPHHSKCPAPVDAELQARIEAQAARTFTVLGCRDWGRMEMRLGPDGELYVLELNPIAGIDPSYWLPWAAEVAGYSYADFVNAILDHARRRNGH
ncbi:MAG: D-alanine--D-alanine ligase [Anaerolineae bacterium]|jgi:D-alanine-D-alanine ligase|nr:D-alanine--D-alanine ligase [Anaerolineae bacterium]